MVKDIKYIIKRILIGVGICLVLSLIRGNLFIMANAETFSNDIPLTYISISSEGYGSNSGSTLPRYQSYGNYISTSFYNGGNYIMTPGNSYYVYYVVEMVAQDLSISNGIQFFVKTSNGNVIQATPDREEYFYLYHTGDNTYTVVYMFGIDSTVNVDTWSFQFNYISDYNANFTQSGITNATLTVVLPDNGSSGGGSSGGGSSIVDLQPVIINQIQNTQTLINNQNSNTQNIINNQNQNNQNIINNQNSNTQDIIDNQNQNAEDIENTINDNFQTCRDSVNLFDKDNVDVHNWLIGNSNHNIQTSTYERSIIVKVLPNTTYTISKMSTNRFRVGEYPTIPVVGDILNNYIRVGSDTGTSVTITTLSNTNYLVINIVNISSGIYNLQDTLDSIQIQLGNVVTSYEPFGKICKNKLDEQNESLNDINNSLNDDSGVNDSDIDDLFGDIRGNSSSPVSDLFTLPITLLQAYLDGMSGTCSPYTLGTLFGTSLVLPCIDIPGIIGTSLWNVIDALFCLYMIYNIAMMCIDIYESYTSLDDAVQLLYSPQHANSRVAQRGGTYDG